MNAIAFTPQRRAFRAQGDKLDLDFSPLRWDLAIHLLDALFYGHVDANANSTDNAHAATAQKSAVGFDESEVIERGCVQMPGPILHLDQLILTTTKKRATAHCPLLPETSSPFQARARHASRAP